jgi:hypothetical protein
MYNIMVTFKVIMSLSRVGFVELSRHDARFVDDSVLGENNNKQYIIG